MIRHPPRPPLFPSTTLFRSQIDSHGAHLPATIYTNGLHRSARVQASTQHSTQFASARYGASRSCKSSPANGDRKSTRLNSSHSQISYAVFCLKKKKNKNKKR